MAGPRRSGSSRPQSGGRGQGPKSSRTHKPSGNRPPRPNSGGGKAGAGKGSGGNRGGTRTGKNGGNRGRSFGRPQPDHRWVPTGDSWRVGVEHGIDLAHFLAENVLGKPSIRQIKRDLEAGRCRVNGVVETFHSRTLYRNDVVEFLGSRPAQQQPITTFEAGRVLYDADDLVAYHKPERMTVVPTDSGKGWNLIRLLRDDLGELLPVHRLDADTTGVVLLARTRELQEAMEATFRNHLIEKTYLAIARGRPTERGEHRARMLLASQGRGHERWRTGTGTGSLTARTTWERAEQIRDLAGLLRVTPHTGRTHQIRVHLADVGHPLLGDRTYGDRKDPILVPRQMLHAWKVRLTHPLTGNTLNLTAPQPDDFSETLEQLRQVR